MIPQNRTWTTGNIDFHLIGTPTQLWPDAYGLSHRRTCDTSAAITNPNCAAGGFQPLDDHYRISNINPLLDFEFIMADELSRRTRVGNIRNELGVK